MSNPQLNKWLVNDTTAQAYKDGVEQGRVDERTKNLVDVELCLAEEIQSSVQFNKIMNKIKKKIMQMNVVNGCKFCTPELPFNKRVSYIIANKDEYPEFEFIGVRFNVKGLETPQIDDKIRICMDCSEEYYEVEAYMRDLPIRFCPFCGRKIHD